MDRSLDEIIGERPERPRGAGGRGRGGRVGGGGDRRPPPVWRAPRREDYPRDGVRKYRRDEPPNIDFDWVHDRFEDDRYDRRSRARHDDDRYAGRGAPTTGSKLRVDNVHYELTEDDLRELFERVGPTISVKLLYDRQDRSQGTAFVIYEDERDARDALYKFDGQNANGQPIRISLMPGGFPARDAGPVRPIADRIIREPRSIFDRITSSREDSRDSGPRPRQRSDSPRKSDRLIPADVDRYMPGRGSRSPIGRRGTPRGGGRRPGERREERGGRGPREPREPRDRKPRVYEEGRSLAGGRPRKTAEELDAEMADYFGAGKGDAPAAEANGGGENGRATGDMDMDMDI